MLVRIAGEVLGRHAVDIAAGERVKFSRVTGVGQVNVVEEAVKMQEQVALRVF